MKLTLKQKKRIRKLDKKPGEVWKVGRYFFVFYNIDEYALVIIDKEISFFRLFSTKEVFEKIENYFPDD